MSLRLCSLLVLVCFPAVVQNGSFLMSYFQVQWFFPLSSSILLMSPSNEIFTLVIGFFCPKVSIWFFITSPVSLLRVSIFSLICVSLVCNCSLKHFFFNFWSIFFNVGHFRILVRSFEALHHLSVAMCWLFLIQVESFLVPITTKLFFFIAF